VHIAARVQMAAVHHKPALHLLVPDAHDLDAEVSGEAVCDGRAEALRSDGRVRQAARSSSAPPS
jgi:hypothetical protein